VPHTHESSAMALDLIILHDFQGIELLKKCDPYMATPVRIGANTIGINVLCFKTPRIGSFAIGLDSKYMQTSRYSAEQYVKDRHPKKIKR
jgi:hypothetical protein